MCAGAPHFQQQPPSGAPGAGAQMCSVGFAPCSRARCQLQPQEPRPCLCWTSGRLPKICPRLWKGQGSQLWLRHGEVRCVPVGCVWEDGKPSALPEAGGKVGNRPLNVVKLRSRIPWPMVRDLQPPRGGTSALRRQGAALRQSLPFPEAELPEHRWRVPTMGASRLSGGEAEAGPPVPRGTGMEEPAELPWRFSP